MRSGYQRGQLRTLFCTADLSLYPHLVGGGEGSVWSPSHKNTIPVHEFPPLDLSTSQIPPPNTITFGGEDFNIGIFRIQKLHTAAVKKDPQPRT